MNIRKQLLSVFGVSLVLTMVLSGYFISFSGNVATGLDDLNAYQEATADALEEFREVELELFNDAWRCMKNSGWCFRKVQVKLSLISRSENSTKRYPMLQIENTWEVSGRKQVKLKDNVPASAQSFLL